MEGDRLLINEVMSWNEFLIFENTHEGNFEFDGINPIKLMSASREHQDVLQRIYLEFYEFLKGSKCKAYLAPITFVYDWDSPQTGGKQKEPDLMVTCDDNYYKGKYFGVPLIIVEVVSPNNFKDDYETKRNLYERIGVQEYWIVNPYLGEVIKYNLDIDSKKYILPLTYKVKEILDSSIFSELKIRLEGIFENLDLSEEDISKFKSKVVEFKIR